MNPDYTAEVATSAAGASGTLAAQMTYVGNEPTFVWPDHIGAIYGGSDNASGAGGTGRAGRAGSPTADARILPRRLTPGFCLAG